MKKKKKCGRRTTSRGQLASQPSNKLNISGKFPLFVYHRVRRLDQMTFLWSSGDFQLFPEIPPQFFCGVCGDLWGNVGICGEMWGNLGICGEMWDLWCFSYLTPHASHRTRYGSQKCGLVHFWCSTKNNQRLKGIYVFIVFYIKYLLSMYFCSKTPANLCLLSACNRQTSIAQWDP
jgi:hypothetical protein